MDILKKSYNKLLTKNHLFALIIILLTCLIILLVIDKLLDMWIYIVERWLDR